MIIVTSWWQMVLALLVSNLFGIVILFFAMCVENAWTRREIRRRG